MENTTEKTQEQIEAEKKAQAEAAAKEAAAKGGEPKVEVQPEQPATVEKKPSVWKKVLKVTAYVVGGALCIGAGYGLAHLASSSDSGSTSES